MRYKLVDIETQKGVHSLDWLTDKNGIQCQIIDSLPPNLASSGSGRVLVKYPDQAHPFPLAVPPHILSCEFVMVVQITQGQAEWIRTVFDGMDDPEVERLLEKLR